MRCAIQTHHVEQQWSRGPAYLSWLSGDTFRLQVFTKRVTKTLRWIGRSTRRRRRGGATANCAALVFSLQILGNALSDEAKQIVQKRLYRGTNVNADLQPSHPAPPQHTSAVI